MSKYFKIIALLFCFVSCSFKGLFVSHLDWFIVNRMDQQLHLYSTQERHLKIQVRDFLQLQSQKVREAGEHINTLNPKKLKVLEELEYFQSLMKSLEKDFRPILINTLISLDNYQREKFLKSFDEKNEEFRKKISNRTVEDYSKRFKYFFGDLSQSQLSLIKDRTSQLRGEAEDWLKQREVLLTNLRSALLNIEGPEKLSKKLDEIYGSYFEKRFKSSKNKSTTDLIKLIVKTLNSDQRNRFVKVQVELEYLVSVYLKKYAS